MIKGEISKYWVEIERNPQPTFLRNLIVIDWQQFSKAVLQGDLNFIFTLIENIYCGDLYILRNVFSISECDIIRNYAYSWGLSLPQSFHKTVDGIPDFHRMATPEIAKSNYSFYRAQHLYYFYRWNSHTGKNLFEYADRDWDLYKTCFGWDVNEFKASIPSEGFVDRLHIHHYPCGVGEQELHSDPYLKQKCIMGHQLSIRGTDYLSGGLYYLGKDKEKINVDSYLSKGDGYISFPTVVHGVEIVDPDEAVNWDSIKGRWFMGYYSLFSDYIADRHTSKAVDSGKL